MTDRNGFPSLEHRIDPTRIGLEDTRQPAGPQLAGPFYDYPQEEFDLTYELWHLPPEEGRE